MDPQMKSTFDVAFVCTGNRARSPLSEAFFARSTLGFDTRTRSFGTLDVGGAPALELAIDVGRRLGVDLGGHIAVALSRGVLADADLVLGFESHHIAAAVVDGAAAPSQTFLLPEFVALLQPGSQADGTAQCARAQVAAANERRSMPCSTAVRTVIPDPVAQPPRVMLATAIEIDEFVRRLVRSLFGPSVHA
jgi:protein-tyrosine-phosphatase